MNAFKYLYYKLYRASLKSSYYDIAEFAAATYLGMFMGMNIMTVFFFRRRLLHDESDIKHIGAMGGLLSLITMSIAWIAFLGNGRSKKIIEQYSLEDERSRKRGNLFVSIYVVITAILVVV